MRFDVAVVGSGPAGATAAYKLAEKGFKVLLVERGRVPGSKNVYGGRVYLTPLKEIYPNFEKEAPIHRWVRKERISLISGERMLTLEYTGDKLLSFTTYLPQLTAWMAGKAEEAGAVLVPEITVDSLLVEDGQIKGIRCGSDEIRADVVIDAEGVNRLLLERAGLVSKPSSEYLALGVKETVKLSEEAVNGRFELEPGEGLAWLFLGDLTQGINGGGFLYTNQDAVNLGIVIVLDKGVRKLKEPIHILAEKMRLHPLLRKYLRDGKVVEYSAHLTCESPLNFMPPKLYGKGLLVIGDAAGFSLNLGYTVRGVDLAAYSGALAAEAVEKAHSSGKIAEDLSIYERMVRKSFIYRLISRFRGVKSLMAQDKIFIDYPMLVTDIASMLFNIEFEVPTLYEALNRARKDKFSLLTLLLDAFRMVRTI